MTAPALPVVDDPLTWCVAQALQTCLCTELAETSAAAACCCIAPGEQVLWDDCTGGQAWVRVVNVYQMGTTFPAAATGVQFGSCGGLGGWAATLELGVLRCLPGVGADLQLPTCEEITAVTRMVAADAHAMRRAVLCCDWRTGCGMASNQFAPGPWTPVGPEGNCVGGTMTVVVEVTGCVCDPPEPDGP